jgi:hypothetical protein
MSSCVNSLEKLTQFNILIYMKEFIIESDSQASEDQEIP